MPIRHEANHALVENGKKAIATVDASEKKIENIKSLINEQDYSINEALNKETFILGGCCEIVSYIIEAFCNFVKRVYTALVGE